MDWEIVSVYGTPAENIRHAKGSQRQKCLNSEWSSAGSSLEKSSAKPLQSRCPCLTTPAMWWEITSKLNVIGFIWMNKLEYVKFCAMRRSFKYVTCQQLWKDICWMEQPLHQLGKSKSVIVGKLWTSAAQCTAGIWRQTRCLVMSEKRHG